MIKEISILLFCSVLLVGCFGFSSKPEVISPCIAAKDTIVLEEKVAGRIFGNVYYEDYFNGKRTPLGGVALQVSSKEGEDKVIAAVLSDVSGSFEFPKLPPGEYVLRTCLSDWDAVEVQLVVTEGAPSEALVFLLVPS